MAAHSITAAPAAASRPKIQGQGPTVRMAAPTLGARMGTPRKTRKLSDITRAMVRPL